MGKLIGICAICGKDICSGEGHYKYDEVCYCSQNCFNKRKKSDLNKSDEEE